MTLSDRIRRALEFDEKQCFNDWSLSHSHDMPFNLFRNGAKYQSEKLKPFRDALISAVESLELGQKLGGYSICYDPPANPGNTLFDVIDKQKDSLANIEAKLKEVEK